MSTSKTVASSAKKKSTRRIYRKYSYSVTNSLLRRERSSSSSSKRENSPWPGRPRKWKSAKLPPGSSGRPGSSRGESSRLRPRRRRGKPERRKRRKRGASNNDSSERSAWPLFSPRPKNSARPRSRWRKWRGKKLERSSLKLKQRNFYEEIEIDPNKTPFWFATQTMQSLHTTSWRPSISS